MDLKIIVRKVSRYLGLLILVITSFSCWAEPQLVTLKLNAIEKFKSTEKRGDELYFHITEYSSLSAPVHRLVPEYPINWLSDYLSDVKNTTLWERSLREGEAVELVLSLTERDVPPWNLDDLVGTIKVKFRHDGNALVQEWSSLVEERGRVSSHSPAQQPKVGKKNDNQQRFLLGAGLYQVDLMLLTK
jgi:hypothetical protein